MGILYQFIEDKQKLNTISINDERNFPIQVSDPFVVQKREAPCKWLKSSTESNNTASRHKK